MRSKAGFSLIELMVAIAITALICSMMGMVFGGLQKSISVSQRGLSDASEGEFLLQIFEQDVRSLVSARLSQPAIYKMERERLDLILSHVKGYGGERPLSVVGYGLRESKGGLKFIRYARGLEWKDALFGRIEKEGGNRLGAEGMELSSEYLKDHEEELSVRVMDYLMYYQYREEKSRKVWISQEPMKEGYQLEAMTMYLVIGNGGELQVKIEGVTDQNSPRVMGEKGIEMPWLERAAQVDQILSKCVDKRLRWHHFERSVEVVR